MVANDCTQAMTVTPFKAPCTMYRGLPGHPWRKHVRVVSRRGTHLFAVPELIHTRAVQQCSLEVLAAFKGRARVNVIPVAILSRSLHYRDVQHRTPCTRARL